MNKMKICNSGCIKSFDSTAESGEMKFSGYGAYFNNVDSYGDVILPGAFKEYIASGRMPLLLSQHGSTDQTPVGVFTSIKEDDKGLWVEGQLADTERGRELYTLLKMGAISGMSIGYFPKSYSYVDKKTAGMYPDGAERLLKAIDLMEISIVSFPANELATVTFVKATDYEGGEENGQLEEPDSSNPEDPVLPDEERQEQVETETEEEGDRTDVLEAIFTALANETNPDALLTEEEQEEARKLVEELRRDDELLELINTLKRTSNI